MMNPLKLLSRVRKARCAGVLSALAGLPAGRERRRGTVLVLVIGALALISVLTLVYATIGQADRRAGATVKRHINVESTAHVLADYFAQKIADETFQIYVNGEYTLTGNA